MARHFLKGIKSLCNNSCVNRLLPCYLDELHLPRVGLEIRPPFLCPVQLSSQTQHRPPKLLLDWLILVELLSLLLAFYRNPFLEHGLIEKSSLLESFEKCIKLLHGVEGNVRECYSMMTFCWFNPQPFKLANGDVSFSQVHWHVLR